MLRTYAFTRIWVPNCARGEDAYSLAVMLREEGLLERTMIYGTDASELAVNAARSGILRFDVDEDPREAHNVTGSTTPLSESAEISADALTFDDAIKRHIIFARHSLVTDGSLTSFTSSWHAASCANSTAPCSFACTISFSTA